MLKNVLSLLLCVVPLASVNSAETAKPNIIFILADDLGCMDIGAFNPKTFYETPHINSLANRGMKFNQAYAACCVCSPTRGSIMTGRYPPRFGITNFIPGGRSGKLLPAPNAGQLALEEVTIAESLRDADYATFFAGKWHLGGDEFYPGAQGFPKKLNSGTGTKGGVQFWYPELDGVSFLPLLKGEVLERGKPLYWHYPHYSNQGGPPHGAIRDGDWKLIEWYEDNSLELYNIPEDVSEKNNLVATQPYKTKAMREKLIAWRKEVNALMPTPKPSK